MGLYDELNQLIRKNGLRNTSGPAYTPLDPSMRKRPQRLEIGEHEVAERLSRDWCQSDS